MALEDEWLSFHSGNTQIIAPDSSWAQRLIGEHDAEQHWQTMQYNQIMDELLAFQYEEPFPWVIVELKTHNKALAWDVCILHAPQLNRYS